MCVSDIAAHRSRTFNIMPKHTQKTVSARRSQFIASWREYAPDETFAGISLEQFEESTLAPLETRARLVEARTKISGLQLERNQADRAMNDTMVIVAHAIRGNPAYGEDGPFYRSLGYIPKSERRSGRSHRTKGDAASNPPDANAA